MSTTWNTTSTGTGSTSSSQRCELDEHDTNGVPVYRYRGGYAGIQIESQHSLSKMLDKNPRVRVSKVEIPRGNSRVDVRTEDLYNDPERTEYQKYPNSKNSVASVGLPRRVFWERLLFNKFPELYIVSPISSPESSPETSQHVSPSSTFPPDRKSRESHRVNATGDS